MKALDLFCGAGGASVGLHRAGYDVTGVDINPQSNYPYEFHRADAMEYPMDGYDLIWASPPCQAYSATKSLHSTTYPELIEPIRERLIQSNTPYVIENVPGAPLRFPVMLCGVMFGLKVFRHRLFECVPWFLGPDHPPHNGTCDNPVAPKRGGTGSRFGGRNGYTTVAGHNFNRKYGMKAMGINWHMTAHEVAESIPPAYSEFIGKEIIHSIRQNSAFMRKN